MTKTISVVREASPRQIAFLRELARERVMPEDARKRLNAALDAHEYGVTPAESSWASRSIEWCLRQPVVNGVVPDRRRALPLGETQRTSTEAPNEFRISHAAAEIGVYQVGEAIYVVKPSKRNPDRRYAVKLVVCHGRMNENGETVDFKYERAPGMVFDLTEADRMPLADMKAFMLRYSRCVRCGHSLSQAKSIERAMGRTCAKKLGLIS